MLFNALMHGHLPNASGKGSSSPMNWYLGENTIQYTSTAKRIRQKNTGDRKMGFD